MNRKAVEKAKCKSVDANLCQSQNFLRPNPKKVFPMDLFNYTWLCLCICISAYMCVCVWAVLSPLPVKGLHDNNEMVDLKYSSYATLYKLHML